MKQGSASGNAVLSLLVETANGRDDAYDLLRLERRSAARRIPREQELRCDLGIDAVAQ